jgi:iron(III) transport system substrate-binding protein
VEATKTIGLVNRLVAEAHAPQADVFWNGEFIQTLALKAHGVLAAYRSAAAEGLPATHIDPDGFWTAMGGRVRVLLINRRLLAGRPMLRSIFDMIDARWPADQIAVAHPLFGTSATQAAALYAALGPVKAREFYLSLRGRGVRVVDGNSVVRDLVAAGTALVGWTDSDDACGAVRNGAPVSVLFPDQHSLGTLVVPATVALVAGAPHPGEARELIDFLLSRETEERLLHGGFSQVAPRNPWLQSECVPIGQVRGMSVSYTDIQKCLDRARMELGEIFLR